MKHVQVLDCTLRDGGYVVDKNFGENVINGLVNGLVKANIDYIEVGFLQNEGFKEGKTIFLNSVDAEKYIPKDKRKSCFTVLADYSRYDIHNLDEYTGKSFDAVRACFFKHEREKVIDFCRIIKKKGYKVFAQPVDILGYSDKELLDLIEDFNKIEPYCVSIVDTFGSMYEEDLHRIFSLIDHNLSPYCRLGFHSHNNLQMSSALSQAFIKMTAGKRHIIIDSTLAGMGRGAGNTPTELLIQYLVGKEGYVYDIDIVLDLIDIYINNIQIKNYWGYSIPYFIAGSYGAHVNNISYLLKKNSIKSKDIRFILNKIPEKTRKRYDYDLVEQVYLEHVESEIDDTKDFFELKSKLENKHIIILAPGYTLKNQRSKVTNFIMQNDAVVIAINFFSKDYPIDYIYMNNTKRFDQVSSSSDFKEEKAIVTSNIIQDSNFTGKIISFSRLIKCGWEHMDNSIIMLLRLLNQLNVNKVSIAGFDGYGTDMKNSYMSEVVSMANVYENAVELNKEIQSMFDDFLETKRKAMKIDLITDSRFNKTMEREIHDA